MKKGRWIGSLLLTVLACVAELRGEDLKWQAVGDSPRADVPAAAALAAPVAIPARFPQRQSELLIGATPLSPASDPGGLLPVSFETSVTAGEPPLHRPPQDIIAVSAPVSSSATPSTEEADEQDDLLFASDRLFAVGTSRPSSRSGIVAASASVVVPSASGVPMVPGWDAPVDASWGVGAPRMPLPVDSTTAAIAPFNPLRPRLYASGEYLLWWIQGQSVPVLATTSAPNDFGVLGAPTTQVLFGGNQINGNSPFSGGRFTVGYWFGCDQSKAVEFTGFFLGSRSAGFSTNSSMNPVIGRPFIEVNNGQQTAQLTALPNVSAGTITISAPTTLWGLAGNLRCLLCCGCNYRISALAGFRNINLDEALTVTENVLGLPTAPQPFTNQTITVTDHFGTQNHFYGGNLGADALWYWGRWSVDVRGQVALGDTVQILNISGSQRFVSPTGAVQNFTGGLLALPSNIGHFTHNAFSVVPEASINLGYQILPSLRAFVGYNFLYWSNVIRPGPSINPVLDVTQIPNFPLHPEPQPVAGQHPAPVFHEVGLWAQGLTFGLQFVY